MLFCICLSLFVGSRCYCGLSSAVRGFKRSRLGDQLMLSYSNASAFSLQTTSTIFRGLLGVLFVIQAFKNRNLATRWFSITESWFCRRDKGKGKQGDALKHRCQTPVLEGRRPETFPRVPAETHLNDISMYFADFYRFNIDSFVMEYNTKCLCKGKLCKHVF